MRNLLWRLAARYRAFILTSALLLAAFQVLMCAIVATTDVPGALRQLMAFAPPLVQTAMSQMLAGGASAVALLGFGWNHPITHALGTAFAITVGARAVAGEIEHGAMELVAAQPIGRTTYLLTWAVFALLGIALISATGVAASLLTQRYYDLPPIPLQRFLLLLGSFVLLQMALFALTLAFSAWGREGGRAVQVGLLIALGSFMVSVVASLWPRVAEVGRYSLHHYFDPRLRLVEGRIDPVGLAILAGVTSIGIVAAVWRFNTRDLP